MDVLSRYIQNSYQLHWTATCRILWYLKEALGKGWIIVLPLICIVGYSDADWAGDPIDCNLTLVIVLLLEAIGDIAM